MTARTPNVVDVDLRDLKDACGLAIVVANCKTRPDLRVAGQPLDDLPTTIYEVGRKVNRTFENLRFSTKYCEEIEEPGQLKAIIKQVASFKYHTADFKIAIYLIGHGFINKKKKHAFCTAKGEVVIHEDIVLPFVPSEGLGVADDEIVKIPRFFFFDCCWGDKPDEAVAVPAGPLERTNESVKELVSESLIRSRGGNLLVAHAVTPHFTSFCLPKVKLPPEIQKGIELPRGNVWSWFLHQELGKDQSIYDALHNTNANMTAWFDACWKEEKLWKTIFGDRTIRAIQQPVVMSTLHNNPITNFYQEAERFGGTGSNGSTEAGPRTGAGLGSRAGTRSGAKTGTSTISGIHVHPLNLEELLDNVKTVKWFRLGLKLGIERYDLDVIESNQKLDAKGALWDVLRQWLKECETPSWEIVIRAMREIGEKNEAKQLEDRFIR